MKRACFRIRSNLIVLNWKWSSIRRWILFRHLLFNNCVVHIEEMHYDFDVWIVSRILGSHLDKWRDQLNLVCSIQIVPMKFAFEGRTTFNRTTSINWSNRKNNTTQHFIEECSIKEITSHCLWLYEERILSWKWIGKWRETLRKLTKIDTFVRVSQDWLCHEQGNVILNTNMW